MPPDFEPIEVAPLHELVIDQIRKAVETWTYGPGDVLPSERDLAQMLGVSRNTVRTATAILQNDGLLSVKRGAGGGYVVQDPALSADRGEYLRRRPEVVLEAWDFRAAVEVGAARRAAERRSSDDLARLDSIFDDMCAARPAYNSEQSLESARRYHMLDTRFHHAIARSTGNQLIIDAVLSARRRLWLAYSAYLTKPNPAAHAGHEKLVVAIRAQDVDTAGSVMREHIELGRQWFEDWLRDPDALQSAYVT